jgi:hypothetical protein
MIELLPLTVSQYFDLEDKRDYDFAMKYAFKFTEPVDEYKIGDVTELTFGFVKDFQFEIEQGLTMEKLVDFVLQLIKQDSIGDEPLDKFCRFCSYLIEGIKSIIETEEIALAYEPTDQEQNAGMDRFKDLGVYLQIRSLTGGDVTKFERVRALPYSLCFTEMFTAKQLKEYENELRKKR